MRERIYAASTLNYHGMFPTLQVMMGNKAINISQRDGGKNLLPRGKALSKVLRIEKTKPFAPHKKPFLYY